MATDAFSDYYHLSAAVLQCSSIQYYRCPCATSQTT